jgi:hypothetical protein
VGLLGSYVAENPRYGTALDFLDDETIAEPGVAGYDVCHESIQGMLAAIADRGEPTPWLVDAVQDCEASLR